MVTSVVNVSKDVCDVYIGRDFGGWEGSKFANPFPAGRTDASRQAAIDKYASWLHDKVKKGEISVAELAALDGKRLGCWYKPRACHGDVLVAAIKWAVANVDDKA